MILNSGKQSEVLRMGEGDTHEMSIDAQDESVLMSILSEGLYKDSIGSTVREWTSNALDSHVEADVKDPVIVSIEQDMSYQWWFKVQDFGVGISEERFEKVVCKYAASTKRHTDTMLGAYGLGLKSGLSYADSFLFTTRFDGIEYQYMMYKGEEKTEIDLIYKKPTTERNGTVFQIQIKNYNDVREFYQKCKQQLCYFENVYFSGTEFRNDFQILKGDGWKYSTLNQDHHVHLCLDNVYYPIDFKRLGIPPLTAAIGLDFKIGDGLIPIPSREDIKYTPSAKQIILDKLKYVCTQIVEKYNDTVTELENFLDIQTRLGPPVYEIKKNDVIIHKLAVNDLSAVCGIPIKAITVKGIETLSLTDVWANSERYGLFQDLQVRGKIMGYKRRFWGEYSYFHPNLLDIIKRGNQHKYIMAKERPKGVHLEYLKDTFETSETYFVYQYKEKNLKFYKTYGALDVPREMWRRRIKDLQRIEKEIMSHFYTLDDYKPTEEWLEERKANRKYGNGTRVGKIEIYPKFPEPLQYRSYEQYCVFRKVEAPIKIEDLKKMKTLHVYGLEEDKTELDRLYSMAKNKLPTPVILSKRDWDRLESQNIHNWINLETFMEGRNRPFQRYVTACRIAGLVGEYRKVFNNIQFIGKLSNKIAKDLQTLSSYVQMNYISCNKELEKEMFAIAHEFDLWDKSIYYLFEEVREYIGHFDFLELVDTQIHYNENLVIKMSKDLLKFRKIKLNFEHYEKTLEIVDEDSPEAKVAQLLQQVESEQITEEELEEQITEILETE